VRTVLVDYNSPVEPGQVLAELDTDRLDATLASSRAQLAAAQARVAEARATVEEMLGNYQRRQTLAERNVVSSQELAIAKAAYDRAIASHASAVAQVQVAEAEVQVNETNLSKACICSPISGIVLDRNIDPGQTVAASLQAPILFTIAEDLSQMELRVDVDEADVGQAGVGQRASFTVDAYPGRRFPAEIRDIRYAPEIVEGVVTYKAVLIIDNSERLLRPGMTATADIVVQEVEEVLLVPNAALRFAPPSEEEAGSSLNVLERLIPRPPRFRTASPPGPDGPERVVWVLREGVATGVAVTLGQSDGRSTEIVAGDLAAGEPVITGTR
jgi:HlyD family secretion protein